MKFAKTLLICTTLIGLTWNTTIKAEDNITEPALCDSGFRQVNIDGFGDKNNVYAWAMKAFEGYLYVGTGHLAATQSQMKGSAELWRYDGQNWEQITDTGFGNPNNTGIRNLTIFNKRLYAAMVNEVDGAEIWSSTPDGPWEKVAEDGFGDRGNEAVRALHEFDNRLYAGLQDTAGGAGELWRSFNGQNWTAIASNGFGFPSNSSVHDVKEWNNGLYIGVRNTESGAQVWRSSDGLQFRQIVGPLGRIPGGFGNPDDVLVFHFHEFNNQLYLSTANVVQGFGIYRTPDGIHYRKVGDPGFGDRDNGYAWRFHTFDGAIWLGVANTNVLQEGGSLWRSFDGLNWEEMVGKNGTYMGYGFDDTRNWGIRSFETYNNKLYIGTAQCPFGGYALFSTGAEVWEWSGEACN